MQLSLWFVLEVTLKSTVLLAVAWLLAILLRRKSAALRHQVWSLALASVLALPLFVATLPAWRIRLSNPHWPAAFLFRTEVKGGQAEPTKGSAATVSPLTHLNISNDRLLGMLWFLGAAASLGQMLIGWSVVERMRRQAAQLTLPEFDGLNSSLGIKRTVDLRQSPRGSMPITFGFTQPAILLPADAHTWSTDRRRAVLLHELAHVKRHDSATQLLARLTLVLYWWHPLAWAAWHQSLKERERAADDLVLNLGAVATDYAAHLLAIARSMRPKDFLNGAAAIAMARPSQLEGRLSAILDADRNRSTPNVANTVASLVVALCVAVPCAALHAGGLPQAGLASPPNTAATALVSKGKAALKEKDYDTAAHFFQQALSADPNHPANETLWLAITEQSRGNMVTAAEFYRKALDAETPSSASAATILELYSPVLTQLDRADEAKKMLDQAQAIRTTQEHQATESHPPSPDAYKHGPEINAPILLSKIEPKYSEDATLAHYTGTSLLRIEIGVDGNPRNIVVLRPLGFGLDQKAVEAVSQWKFQPGVKDGLPVVVMAQVEVSFRLL